jgi:hypothetical protein
VVGETEVVVGAEIQNLSARLDGDCGILRRGDDPLLLVETLGAKRVDFGAQVLKKTLLHR